MALDGAGPALTAPDSTHPAHQLLLVPANRTQIMDCPLWDARARATAESDPVGARLRFRPSVLGAAFREGSCADAEQRRQLHLPGLDQQAGFDATQCKRQSPSLLAVSDVHGVIVYAWRNDGALLPPRLSFPLYCATKRQLTTANHAP